LKRIGLALRFVEHDAVRVVVVGVDLVAVAAGQADDRALPIEEVVVLASTGQTLIEKHAAATTGVVGGVARGGFVAQAQAAVGIAGAVDAHALGLIGAAVAVTVTVDGGGLVLFVVAETVAVRGTGQVAVAVVAIGHGG